MKDDKFYLIQIAEDIDRLEKFTAGGKSAFMNEEVVQRAVLRTLQTLGESVKRLSDNLKSKYPEVAWKGIVALRNVLVHDYLEIDLDEVWNIVALDVPVLKVQVQKMLADLGGV
ncbi:MAG: DUF86 domain-containing protein [Deltaproteobacteria bacterium]|nr:DUF86 domain-containing protein [Deltaproteobacteria bacterium]